MTLPEEPLQITFNPSGPGSNLTFSNHNKLKLWPFALHPTCLIIFPALFSCITQYQLIYYIVCIYLFPVSLPLLEYTP